MDKISEESKHQKDKDELLKLKIKDKIKIAQNKNRYMDTDFLDLREQEIIKNEIIKNRYQNIILYGGHERSERKVLIAYTEQYEYILENIYNEILNIIRIQNPKEYYKKYDHRTYLGALIKLGIKREKIGDIIVKENGADIICKSNISKFIASNINTLTRFQKSKITIENISDLEYNEPEKQIFKIIVQSMRLDSIIAELANTSRNKAQELIQQERVFVNFKEELRASLKIEENSYITIRGKGRFKINKILNTTKSGRIVIEIEK